MKAASILLSALFTGLVAESMGLLLLRRLRPPLMRQEQYVYAFVIGSALLSLTVFLTAAAHLVWTPTFVVIGAASIAACITTKAYVPAAGKFPPLPWIYRLLLWGVMLAYGVLAGMNALAPEASADGTMYHLGLVQRYLDQHGFGRIITSMYANLPLGIEMLFLFAFSLGRHSAAALVHFQFLIALPLLMLAVARRFGYPRAGVAAGLFLFASPIFVYDGSSAYVDVAMAAIVVALFGALQIWDESRESALLPIIGLLAGFAYAAKMTAFVAIPYAVVFVGVKLLRRGQPVWKPLAMVCGCILLMCGPWMLKNSITVGNPFSPFLNRYFPNPYIRISFEEGYRRTQENYDGLKSYWDIPYEVTIGGGVLNGLLGPVFLLAPLGLLAIRWKAGRQALLGAAVFASTYPNNVGTRFLMGAAPFLALAMALTISHWRAMAPLLIVFHAVVSWPDAMRTYVHPYSWRLDKFYWKAAFRVQAESEYLNERIGEYAPARLVDHQVPNGGRVFTFGGIAHAYCRREVIVAYESALGNTLGDFVATGMFPFYQPVRWWTYSFPKQSIQKLRLVQTGSRDVWSVSEVRLLGPGGEIERQSDWRIKASPNPWQAQYAFDNCPVTRWIAAERSKPGMFVEMDLAKPRELAGVRVEASQDQVSGTARLEAEVDGNWRVLAPMPAVSDGPPLSGMRRLAADDLKRSGVTHISVSKGEFFYEDMVKNPEAWGVSKVGEAGSATLFRID